MSSRVIRPPPPWPIWIVGLSLSGIGQSRTNSSIMIRRGPPPVAPPRGPRPRAVGYLQVRRARPLGGDHRRPERVHRGAARSECGALLGFLDALQDEPADALRVLRGGVTGDLELARRIEGRVRRSEAEPARGDLPDSPPLARDHGEHLGEQVPGGDVPFPPHRAGVLVLDLRPALLELEHAHVNALQDIERLESGDDDRDLVVSGDGLVLGVAHDRADVARGEEPLHPVVPGPEDRLHRRRDEDVRDEDGEVGRSPPPSPGGPPSRWPGRWSRSRRRGRRPPSSGSPWRS